MNTRGYCFGAVAASVIAVFSSTVAFAEPSTWQVRGSVGLQNYELSFEDIVTPLAIVPGGSEFTFRDGFEIGDNLTFGGVGVTAGFGRFFVDVSGQWSEDGNDNGEQFQGANPFPGIGVNHSYDAKFDRQELNVTVGYGVSRNLSVFLGYKDAETALRNTLFPVGSIEVAEIIFDGDRAIDFSYDGVFAGASAAVPIQEWYGAFSLQAAVAFLDGKFRDRFVGEAFVATPFGFELLPSFIDSTISGDSTGVNVGAAWTGSFGKKFEKLSYTLGLDHSQYEFDTKQSTTGNFEEKNTRYRLDLRYRF